MKSVEFAIASAIIPKCSLDIINLNAYILGFSTEERWELCEDEAADGRADEVPKSDPVRHAASRRAQGNQTTRHFQDWHGQQVSNLQLL